MRYLLAVCALFIASPGLAGNPAQPPQRISLGSARATVDLQQCLSPKLGDLGPVDVSGTAQNLMLTYGTGKDQIIVEIADGGDLRLVTVRATRKIASGRQDTIRACMY